MDTTSATRRGTYWVAKSADEKLLEKLILDTLREHGASGWTVIFGRQSGALGYCEYTKKEICISRRVILTSWEAALDIALHEVAHALAGHRAAHGPAWKAAARKIGASPQAKAEFHFEDRNGELKTVKTDYGTVRVRIGDEIELMGKPGKMQITDIRRTKLTAKDARGVSYDFSVNRLHPNYGTSKVPQNAVTLKDRKGQPFKIMLGETVFSHGGRDYTAVWVKGKIVWCVNQGIFIRVDQTLFAGKAGK